MFKNRFLTAFPISIFFFLIDNGLIIVFVNAHNYFISAQLKETAEMTLEMRRKGSSYSNVI